MICTKCKLKFNYIGYGRQKKYCSVQCRLRAKWNRKQQKYSEVINAKIRAKVKERNKGKICFACKNIFDAYRSNQIFCSTRCCHHIHSEMYQHRKYNASRGAKGTHTRYQWEMLKERYNFMCLCCKRQEPEIKLEEDHVVPLTKGGDDTIDNIQPLCRSCNSQKYNRVEDFRVQTNPPF